jgi:ABC-type Fe3+-hydroxamate transport system substrate-binding protein
VVTRPPELANDALLPVRHSEQVGEAVLAWMDDRYNKIRPTVPRVLTAAAVRDGVQACTTTGPVLTTRSVLTPRHVYS